MAAGQWIGTSNQGSKFWGFRVATSQQTVDIDAQALMIFDQDVAEPTEEAAPPEPVQEADAAATIETEGGTAVPLPT